MTRPKTRTDPLPYWLYRATAKRPTARTVTVRNLIRRTIAETGQAPTDEDLARLLAISVSRVRHHRRILGL